MTIVLTEITKIYNLGEREVRALDGISIKIAVGEFVAITGPAGSGKSTLVNILGGLDRPTSGSYKIDGEEVVRDDNGPAKNRRQWRLGFVFQNFNILPRMTLLQHVMLPLIHTDITKEERRERAALALNSVGLGDRMRFHPNELSAVHRQQIAIARALVNEPNIMLADEPAGHLDAQDSSAIMKLFSRLSRQGRTIIAVHHNDHIAGLAQRVIAVRNGRLASNESTAETGNCLFGRERRGSF